MKRIKVGVVLLGLVMITNSCDRAENYLPKATQTGENTAGWMIHEVAYKQSHPVFIDDVDYDTKAKINATGGTCSGIIFARSVSAFNTSKDYHKDRSGAADDRMYIYIKNLPAKEGTYTAKDGIQFRYERIVDRQAKSSLNYYSDPQSNDTLVITHFDPVKKIISGTFSFHGKLTKDETAASVLMASFQTAPDIKELIEVKRGRFDMRMDSEMGFK